MTNFIIELEQAVQQIKLPPCKETAQNQATEPQPQIGFLTYSLSDVSFADKNTIPWQSVNYHRVYSDVESLVQYLQAGYCFTSIFNTTNTTQTLKTYPNWYGTQCVVFDIDNVRVDVSFQEFMSRVPMKPTFAYTTRNHGLIKPEDTKPYSRFRLVYVFDKIIRNKAVYQELYNRIDASFPTCFYDTEKPKDNCMRSPVQNISGNSTQAEWFLKDEHGFVNLFRVSDFVDETEAMRPEPKQPSKKPQRYHNKYRLDDDFNDDLYHMHTTDFLGKYFAFFGVPMMHTPLKYKDGYGITPENFRELKPRYVNRQIEKWRDHEGRRSKMFIFCKIRMIMKPDITLEELVYNLVYDRLNFFDNKDKVLTNETLIRIAYNAMHTDYEIKQSEMKRPKFKIDKTFCIEHGTTPNAYKNTVRQILNFESIDAWYDPTKSVYDNLKFAKDNEKKVCKDTLYSYCKARAINTKGTKPTEPQNPSPATPPEPQKPSAEPSEALEQNEAVQSAQEPQKPSAKILAIDFSEYHSTCKLYQTIFGNRTTNKNLTLYNYDRKQEEAAAF